MSDTVSKQVKRRRVFYIPGYDPIHPRRYRELYRKEGAAQAQISGYEIGITPKLKSKTFGWQAHATIDGQEVDADIDVLVWSDIVRDSMSNSIPATYLQLIRTAWTYIGTGTLGRLMKMRKGPVIAALYPIGMLLLQLLLSVLFGYLVFNSFAWICSAAYAFFTGKVLFWSGPFAVMIWTASIFGVIAGVWLLRWFKAKDGKFFAYYLMHDYSYSARWNGANPPPLEARIAEFSDKISVAFTDEVDEVLVVGHSSGAHLSVSILADLLRAGRVPQGGPKLAFLSLGQVVPMVSFLPDATRLRGDLAYLSTQETVTWVDVTAPGDGCAFALCDPVAVTGVAPDNKRWPLVISAAFTKTLKPETWKALRWRFFRLHFQYLCAFDNPGDYDYFQITCGPQFLVDRYRGRAPSKSRIETPLSKYTTTL